jgi:hypothetical protein
MYVCNSNIFNFIGFFGRRFFVVKKSQKIKQFPVYYFFAASIVVLNNGNSNRDDFFVGRNFWMSHRFIPGKRR